MELCSCRTVDEGMLGRKCWRCGGWIPDKTGDHQGIRAHVAQGFVGVGMDKEPKTMTDSTVRRVIIETVDAFNAPDPTGDYEDIVDQEDGTHALLPWSEYQAMMDVVEAAKELQREQHWMTTKAAKSESTYNAAKYLGPGNRLADALDALRRVREEE